MKIICIEAKKVIGTSVAETVVQLIDQNAKAKHYVNIGVDVEDYYRIKDSEKETRQYEK